MWHKEFDDAARRGAPLAGLGIVEAWVLLLSEIVGLRKLRTVDADILSRKTLIPGRVWIWPGSS